MSKNYLSSLALAKGGKIIMAAVVFVLLAGTVYSFEYFRSQKVYKSEQAKINSGVLEGKVTVGPICPVERAGVPCPVPEAAYTSREVVVYRADGTTEVARQHFTKDGSYKFELVPGTYIINTPRQVVGGSKDLPQTVIIKAGETVNLNFDIDTGIR